MPIRNPNESSALAKNRFNFPENPSEV